MAVIIKHHRARLVEPPPDAGAAIYRVVSEAPAVRWPAGAAVDATRPAATPAEPDPSLADLLAQAQVEADAIRTAAGAEASLLREQAWHEGYQAGLDEGRSAAARVVDTSVERLRTLASAAVADRAAMLRDAERQVFQLVITVARAVIQREIALDPGIVVTTLDTLLSHIQGEVVTALLAHPDDIPLLTTAWEERARSAADRQVQITPDHRIARGGCRVETLTGAWDGALDTQLERIHQAFQAAGGRDR